MAAPRQTLPAPFCVIRPQISIRRRWGIWKAVALSESAASEVESFDLFILRMLSASLIFTTLFFPPPVKSPVSSISWWRAERGVPEALSVGLELKPTVPGPITARGRGRFHCSVNGAFPWQPYSGSIIPPFWTSMGRKVQPGHLEAHPLPAPFPPDNHPPPTTNRTSPHRLSDLFLPRKDFQMGLIWRIESSQASSFKMQECKKSIKVGNLQQLCSDPITDLPRSQGHVFLLGELEGGEKKQEIDGGFMYSLPCR